MGLTYGQRALLIGALDARNFVGTAEHSRYGDRPFKRLAATGKMFETVFFGSKRDADRVLDVVDRMHNRVEGKLGADSGGFAPGTRYSAHDSELMLWTIAVAAESAATLYALFVRRLDESELDCFWADWIRFGELFGMDRSVAPPDWSGFRAWFDSRLGSGEMGLTGDARRTGMGVCFRIPVSTVQSPVMELHNMLILGSLPERVRDLYGLRWSAPQRTAWLAATRAIRASRMFSPKRVARGRNGVNFDSVARTETRRIAAGRPPIRLAA